MTLPTNPKPYPYPNPNSPGSTLTPTWAGFIHGYQYIGRTEKIKWTDFFIKRFASLYPVYILALLLGKPTVPTHSQIPGPPSPPF